MLYFYYQGSAVVIALQGKHYAARKTMLTRVHVGGFLHDKTGVGSNTYPGLMATDLVALLVL